MSGDAFSDAGQEFRRLVIRNSAARDQGAQALAELVPFCQQGIERFYNAARTDVYVERLGDGQASIRYGFRPGKFHKVLHGPWAVIFVTPDGRLLWSETDGWLEPGSPDPPLKAIELDAGSYVDSVTPKLISFLRKSETQYQNATA